MSKSRPRSQRIRTKHRSAASLPFSDTEVAFSDLGRSIIQSLSIGVIAFDVNLTVMEYNERANQLLELLDTMDHSLAKGTDSNIWGNWTELLKGVIETGNKSHFESVRYTKGDRARLLSIVCTPLREEHSGIVIGGALVLEDVTEKVEIQQQLEQAERLAAIGKMAGKVAHELNNPIDGILRYINLTMRNLEEAGMEKSKGYLDHCRKGLMRMVGIVGELLEFSRGRPSGFDYARVDEIVNDSIKSMESQSQEVDIRVHKKCPKGVPKIRAGNLYQVFCNLLKNAFDAMEGKGRLDILMKVDGDYLSVQFRDTGPGIPKGYGEMIFEPFFSTKEKGKGTGLGLAICKDIVEKYDGRITASNAKGGGSIFTVRLPLKGNL